MKRVGRFAPVALVVLAWIAAALLAPTIPGRQLAGLAREAWLLESVLVIVLAPILGAAVRRGHAQSIAVCSIASTLLGALAGIEWTTNLTVHVTLGLAALALAAFGRWCASIFVNPLDAAAASLTLSLILGFGVLVGGPAIAALPVSIVNAALVASPLVTTAWAAGIDLFRTDLLYRISPIAHGYYDYPRWQTAAASYGIATAVFFAAHSRSGPRPNRRTESQKG